MCLVAPLPASCAVGPNVSPAAYAAAVAALGTSTLTEIASLGSATVRLARLRWVPLVGWFCAGWAVHQVGLFCSALLGVHHEVLANLVFVLSVVARLVALVLMVNAVRPILPSTPATDPATTGTVPAGFLAGEHVLDVITASVGPFLAVYAVWGFVDDEVSALFRSNYIVQGLGGVDTWSVSLDTARVPLYLGFAAVSWVVRAVVRLALTRVRRRSSAVAMVGVVAEGVWALSVFVVLLVAARLLKAWLVGRVVWADLASAGQALLSVLPSVTLSFGPTLREAARSVATEAPGVLATVVGLPLMWLALAAVVYGWREVSAADLFAGTRAAPHLERWSRSASTPAGRLLVLATDDLRTKYLPVLQALRLVARAGPRLIGAYVLLATVLQALDDLLRIGLSVLVGPQSVPATLLLDPVQDLVVSLVVTCLSVALYGVVFARAVGAPLAAGATSDLRAAAPASGRGSPAAVPTGARPHRPGRQS